MITRRIKTELLQCTREYPAVTIRDRDSMEQQRIAEDQVLNYLRDKLGL